ncbi:MAG TPA: MgtC/SapB family protein [Casimicrobiaceae bacterium]|nr:MgtC/SapB family protein [Casimicrobiaceae bacterium]
MSSTILATLRDEFADLSDPEQFTRVAVRLVVAVVLGAAIGYEREKSSSTAGLRTHMLVALGVALVIVAAEQSGFDNADVSRVLQGVLAGIGFLGAGAILKQADKAEIKGLTTAASIWSTAAIAIAAGLGKEATAILATAVVVVILSLLLRLERRMQPASQGNHASDDSDKGGSESNATVK